MSTSVLRYSGLTNDNRGYEIWHCNQTAPTTTSVITPSLLKGIDMVTITPMNAAAATAAKGYITTFVPGTTAVTITGVATAMYLAKIEGTVS